MTDLSPSPSDPSDVNFPGLLRAHRTGSSRLTLARLPSWLFGCCLLLTLGLLHILSTVSYTETMPFRGVLVGAEGQFNVASRRQGIVDSVRVTQGSYVEAGAVLLTLNTEVFDPSGRPLSARERDSLNARRQLLLERPFISRLAHSPPRRYGFIAPRCRRAHSIQRVFRIRLRRSPCQRVAQKSRGGRQHPVCSLLPVKRKRDLVQRFTGFLPI
jgi:hypothetical protein